MSLGEKSTLIIPGYVCAVRLFSIDSLEFLKRRLREGGARLTLGFVVSYI
jgi:hypothetical protein